MCRQLVVLVVCGAILAVNCMRLELDARGIGRPVYEAKIAVGAPPKTFVVDISTNHALTWLPEFGCTSSRLREQICNNQSLTYNPKESSTSEPIMPSGYEFIDQTRDLQGTYYEDSVQFGDFTIKSMLFGAGRKIGLKSPSGRGVLGLGLTHESVIYYPIIGRTTLGENLTEPFYSIWLGQCTEEFCPNAGRLSVGEHDDEHCEPLASSIQMRPNLNLGTGAWYFQLEKADVSQDGTSFTKLTAVPAPENPNVGFPENLLNQFLKVTEHKLAGFGAANQFSVACDYQGPDLKFWVKPLDGAATDRVELVVPFKQLVTKTKKGTCQLLVEKSPNAWVHMGAPFARTYCIYHQMALGILGFQKVKA